MQINGPQQAELREAILSTFSYLEYRTFLRDRHNLDLDAISTIFGTYDVQVGDSVLWFNHRGTIGQLVSTLVAERSEIPAFRELAHGWGIFPAIYGGDDTSESLAGNALESIIKNGGPIMGVNEFVAGITDAKRCVCRIELEDSEGSKHYGTGFLVGDDLVLTNHHVMEPVISDNKLAASVICKFDYEVDSAGKTINAGTDVGLAGDNAVLASSPPGYYDISGSASINVEWKVGELDYALVRLATKLGSKPYGLFGDKTSSSKATKRGWIRKSSNQHALTKGSNIIILQHPNTEPMKIAIGMNRIEGCDVNKRRVRYKLSTMAGSSGSPCFDEKFNWIALHNSGDPDYYPKYNQGIPASRIVEDLKNNKDINL